MKNFFLKLTFAASMLAMFVLTACEPQNNKSFGLSVKEVGQSMSRYWFRAEMLSAWRISSTLSSS